MAEITYKGKSFEVDEDGFLLRFDDWCPEWMDYVKESEGISEINADHQKILDFLQDYYKKNGIRYKYYRHGCGRDDRLKELWGEK